MEFDTDKNHWIRRLELCDSENLPVAKEALVYLLNYVNLNAGRYQ